MNKNWLNIKTLWEAYEDCALHKRSTASYLTFELDELENLYSLFHDLNNLTYEIGVSTAFVITRPKIREVFAAMFRDRIVHHLVILKTMHLFEANFINDTYSCRLRKGTLYGIKQIQKKMQERPNDWVLKLDLKGFFMSIDKALLRDKLKDFIYANYKEDDIEQIWWLIEAIVMNRPEIDCIKNGDISLFDKVEPEKSLLKSDGTKGLAIGNLTSQIFANFYLDILDKFITQNFDVEYGRYVDDFVIIGEKETLLDILYKLGKWLKDNLHVTLHPNKIYLQHVSKGVRFIGATIKPYRTYISNNTRGTFIDLINYYNKCSDREKEQNIVQFVQSFNSYMGFMRQHQSYNVRKDIWDRVDDSWKEYIYIQNMEVAKICNKYKKKSKKKHGNKNRNKKRRLQRKRANRANLDCSCYSVKER